MGATMGRCKTLTLWVSLAALSLLASGCSAIRADVGLGFGLGAEMKLPYIAHPGFAFGKYKYFGSDYGTNVRDGYWDLSMNFISAHLEEEQDRFVTLKEVIPGAGYETHVVQYAGKNEHYCPGILPFLFDGKKRMHHSRPLEIRVYLLFVGFRLGVDPTLISFGADEESEESP